MDEHTIEVYGLSYQVKVYQRSKSVWIAFGYYEGTYLEGKGRSDTTALADWRMAARFRGDAIPFK